MAETKDNMVLRTVYLPLGLDRELRQLAFTRDVSKADLIREFILQGLTKVEASGEKTLATRVQERIDHRETVVTSALASDRKKTKKLIPGRRRRLAAKRVTTA